MNSVEFNHGLHETDVDLLSTRRISRACLFLGDPFLLNPYQKKRTLLERGQNQDRTPVCGWPPKNMGENNYICIYFGGETTKTSTIWGDGPKTRLVGQEMKIWGQSLSGPLMARLAGDLAMPQAPWEEVGVSLVAVVVNNRVTKIGACG